MDRDNNVKSELKEIITSLVIVDEKTHCSTYLRDISEIDWLIDCLRNALMCQYGRVIYEDTELEVLGLNLIEKPTYNEDDAAKLL